MKVVRLIQMHNISTSLHLALEAIPWHQGAKQVLKRY